MTKEHQNMIGLAALNLIQLGAIRIMTIRTWRHFRWYFWASWLAAVWFL